jgi:hypothetical protein
MFLEMCREVARAVGQDTLIPSPSIHESSRLLPMNVVVIEEKRTWVLFKTVVYSTHALSVRFG